MSQNDAASVGEAQLRSRARKTSKKNAQSIESEESIKAKVMRLNMDQTGSGDGKARKMFGRTPDGTSEFCIHKKTGERS
jgi:hypothetical protein